MASLLRVCLLAACWGAASGLAAAACSERRSSPEAEVIRCILSASYDPQARPVENHSDVVQVNLSMSWTRAVDVIEKDSIFAARTVLHISWMDPLLTWDPESFAGVDRVWIDPHRVWKPDIVLYNYAEDTYDRMLENPVLVTSTGFVLWMPNHSLIKSYCKLDFSRFPWDTQKCYFMYGSNSYDMSLVNITSPPNDKPISPYQGTEWLVKDVNVTRHVAKFGGLEFPIIIFKTELERNSNYYRQVFVLPTVLIALVTLISLLIPVESGERLVLGSGLLIGNTVLLSMLENHIPTHVANLSLIGMYLIFNLVMLTSSLLISVLVLGFYHDGKNRKKMPNFVRQLFLGKLSRLVCIRTQSYVPIPPDENSITNVFSIDDEGQEDVPEVNLSTEKTLQEIHSYLRILVAKAKNMPERSFNDNVMMEWRELGAVVDRLFFMLYSIIWVIMTLIIYGRG